MKNRDLLTVNWSSLTPRQQTAAIEVARLAGRREMGRREPCGYTAPLEMVAAYDRFVSSAFGKSAAESWIDSNPITAPADDPRVWQFAKAAFSRTRHRRCLRHRKH